MSAHDTDETPRIPCANLQICRVIQQLADPARQDVTLYVTFLGASLRMLGATATTDASHLGWGCFVVAFLTP
jgi:hypothetical protein